MGFDRSTLSAILTSHFVISGPVLTLGYLALWALLPPDRMAALARYWHGSCQDIKAFFY